MPQYLVQAYDGTDEEAPARRAQATPAHIECVDPMIEAGTIMSGGLMQNDQGHTVGTAAFVDFPTRAKLDEWLANDPYTIAGVWQRFEIMPMVILTPKKSPE